MKYIIWFLICCGVILGRGGLATAKDFSGCKDLNYIYARGSGAERNNSDEWRALKAAAARAEKVFDLSYEVYDLEYKAVAVDSVPVLLGAAVSGGKAFEYGASVREGVENLAEYIKDYSQSCSGTKFILVGYSQGASVIAGGFERIDFRNILYAALLGDPNLYLPEGKGFLPEACFGSGLSSYRVYAPNCRTYEGIFGAKKPYVAEGYGGKIGLWCNRDDLICGSSRNLFVNEGHLIYDEKGHFDMVVLKALRGYPKKLQSSIVGPPVKTLPEQKGAILRASVTKIIQEELLPPLALLAFDEYYTEPGKEIIFDASESYSFDSEISKYEWDLDGDALFERESAGPIMSYTLTEVGEHKISLRVTDMYGLSSVVDAKVFVREYFEEQNMLSPQEIELSVAGENSLKVDWSDDVEAPYLLITVNSVILGYTEARIGKILLEDLDLRSEIKIVFTSVDGDHNLGASVTKIWPGLDEQGYTGQNTLASLGGGNFGKNANTLFAGLALAGSVLALLLMLFGVKFRKLKNQQLV